MGNQTFERQIDLLINLMENLPKKMCDELDLRSAHKKTIHAKEIQAEINFHRKNIDEIHKMISVYPENNDE